MLFLTQRRIGRLTDLRLGQTVGKALLAAGAMAAGAALALSAMVRVLDTSGLVGKLTVVVVPAGLSVVVYLGLLSLLRVDEITLFRTLIRQRFQGKRTKTAG